MNLQIAVAAKGLRHAFGAQSVLGGVDLEVARGEFVSVVGPNGAGKSTLLRLLIGLLHLQEGSVDLFGRPLAQQSRREVARLCAFVPQGFHTEFAFTVREMVAMGRTPYLGRFRPESPDDEAAIFQALEATDLNSLWNRRVTELSGGEQQRVLLARAFAQGSPLLVLDEPNASLDLFHAHQLLQLTRNRVDGGGTALVALHDLALAAKYCDRMIVLNRGEVHDRGRPADVLKESTLREVFGVEAAILEAEGRTLIDVKGPATS
jgi:iron complex transport system ATP-binding protein